MTEVLTSKLIPIVLARFDPARSDGEESSQPDPSDERRQRASLLVACLKKHAGEPGKTVSRDEGSRRQRGRKRKALERTESSSSGT